MEQVINEQEQARKIYSMRSIWIGTFLGGPLTAGYLVAENFKTLGQKEKVKLTWTIAIVATVIIFGGIFMIPNSDKIPRQIIPLIYSAIAYYIVNETQGDGIKAYISDTGKVFSAWRSAGVGLIWVIITITPILIYVLLTDPTLTATTKSYGQLKHEIYYTKGSLSESEVDKIADALTQTVFFDEEQQKVILLEKKDNRYIISIPIIKDAWDDQEVISYFESLQVGLQTLIKDNKVIINLCSDEDITQIKKVLDGAAANTVFMPAAGDRLICSTVFLNSFQ